MLIQIKESGATPRPNGDISAALVDCHDRVRYFTALAITLATRSDASVQEIADAARRIDQYFTQSLPLHQQDEEESLLPRLAPKMDEAGRSALQRMTHEHEQINLLANQITSLARAIAAEPSLLLNSAPELQAQAETLQQIWEHHLPLEEELIFPQIEQLLDAKTRGLIQAEMQGRRK